MTFTHIKKTFGLNPEDIGIRQRGFWIVDSIDEEEKRAGAEIGDLCVQTRDGDCPDKSVTKYSNYLGSVKNPSDITYRLYYFKKLS